MTEYLTNGVHFELILFTVSLSRARLSIIGKCLGPTTSKGRGRWNTAAKYSEHH